MRHWRCGANDCIWWKSAFLDENPVCLSIRPFTLGRGGGLCGQPLTCSNFGRRPKGVVLYNGIGWEDYEFEYCACFNTILGPIWLYVYALDHDPSSERGSAGYWFAPPDHDGIFPRSTQTTMEEAMDEAKQWLEERRLLKEPR